MMDLTLTGTEHLCNTFNNTCLEKNYYGLILKALLSIMAHYAHKSLYEHSILDNVNVEQCTVLTACCSWKVDLLLPPYPQKHDQPSEEQPTASEKPLRGEDNASQLENQIFRVWNFIQGISLLLNL